MSGKYSELSVELRKELNTTVYNNVLLKSLFISTYIRMQLT